MFDDAWPETIRSMATRKWGNININNSPYEVQSTFFRNGLSDSMHDAITMYLLMCQPNVVESWLGSVCSRLLSDELDEDWFAEQEVNRDLRDRYQVRICAVLTYPADRPGNQDVQSVHVGFILANI